MGKGKYLALGAAGLALAGFEYAPSLEWKKAALLVSYYLSPSGLDAIRACAEQTTKDCRNYTYYLEGKPFSIEDVAAALHPEAPDRKCLSVMLAPKFPPETYKAGAYAQGDIYVTPLVTYNYNFCPN